VSVPDPLTEALWQALQPKIEGLVAERVAEALAVPPERAISPRRHAEWATVEEAAAHVSRDRRYVYGLIRRDKLTRYPIDSNGPARIKWAEIDDLDAGRPTGEEARRLEFKRLRTVAR
jgi:hypothetical protein